jgi:anti-anti-sigma factor
MAGLAPFSVTASHPSPSWTVLAVAGELDLGNSEALRGPMLAAIEASSPSGGVVLDLTDCTFCDSSGLRVIMSGFQKATNSVVRFRVAGADPAVARVFELTGTAALFKLAPDAESAMRENESES